jgi:hypothetical protein
MKKYIPKLNTGDKQKIIKDIFLVSEESSRGYQYCPFHNTKYPGPNYRRECGSSDFTILNLTNGKQIKFGSLLEHLIREHQGVIDVINLPHTSHKFDYN